MKNFASIILISSALFLLLAYWANATLPATTPEILSCASPFPLGYSPSEVTSVSNDRLLIIEKNSATLLNTLSMEEIFVYSSVGNIQAVKLENNGSFLLSTKSETDSQVISLDRSGSEALIRTFPLSTHISLGDTYFCATSIQTISDPNEIATTISIYSDTGEHIKTLTSPLTLIPMQCADTSLLSPPYPLASSLYSWNKNETNPNLVLKLQENESLIPTQNGAAVVSDTGRNSQQILEYRAENGNITSTDYGTIPGDVSFSLSRDGLYILSENVITFRDPSGERFYALEETTETFTDIIPFSRNRFGLISDNGELWILQCNQKFRLGLIDSILE